MFHFSPTVHRRIPATGPGQWHRLLVTAALLSSVASALSQAASPADDRLPVLRLLVADPSPAVRAEALRALARIPTAEAADLALSVLDLPMDAHLDYALWLTFNDLATSWIQSLQSGEWKAEGRENQLAFALQALPPAQTAQVLQRVLGDQPLPRDGTGPWIEAIGKAGGPDSLKRLFQQVTTGDFDEPAAVRALRALAEAARFRQQLPATPLADFSSLLQSPSEPVRLEALRLAALWKEVPGLVPPILERVRSSSATAEERTAAVETLRQLGGPEALAGLQRLAGTDADAGVRRQAVLAWAALDARSAMPAVLELAASLSEEQAALSFWREALGVRGMGDLLKESLPQARLPEPVSRAGMRAAREGGRDDVELVAALAQAGGLTTDSAELTQSLLHDLAEESLAQGDPHRGERLYRRPDLACVTCHAIGGVGGKVGPDLTSIGASAPLDYLVESLLLPHAKIKEGYHSVVVETRDGEEYTGTLARENQEQLVLRNAAGQELALAKSTLVSREMGRLSLMPSGLLESLTAGERRDLIAFLSQLGKPGPFDASQGGVARLWRVANVVHTDIQNNQADWFWKAPWNHPRWSVVPAWVQGQLTADLLEEATRAQAWTSKVETVLATEMETAAPGPVTFRVIPTAAALWVEGRPVTLSDRGPIMDLAAGRHRVVIRLEPRRIPESLRLEATGASFLLE
jgi:putative heme-binding domain-containing protein